MRDDEVTHLLAGWAAVFIGAGLAVFFGLYVSVLIGLFWSLLAAAGILVLIYAFLRWRVPAIIDFVKNRGWENEWTRSLGL